VTPNAAESNAAPEKIGPARKIYQIVKYGDPILEKPSKSITKFDAELEELAEDMFATMYAAQGIGLAAPQIGKVFASPWWTSPAARILKRKSCW